MHPIVLQDARPTFKDRCALTWLQKALEQLPVAEPFDLGAWEPRQVSIGTTVTMRRCLWTEANS
jgi:hypothetical protein